MNAERSLLIPTALLPVLLTLVSSASLAQTSAVRARVVRPVDMQERVVLRGNVHPLARREFDQGVAPDDLPLQRILLVLRRGEDQETALRQLLDDQQVKSSARFHQWVTPEQFGQQFGSADSDVQAVTDWLASQGFQVIHVAAGRTVIEFSGTAGLARQVLGTEIHRFRVDGEDHWANISDPQIPAALAPVVAGFASLNNFPSKPLIRRLGTFRKSKLTGDVQPLFTFPYDCGSHTCAYYALGPGDFAVIYNVIPLWTAGIDGTGQTIAVLAEGDINPQDVADFRSMFGLPANPPNIILNGPDPGIIAYDESEADLDVQWTGAVAKGATIDFVVSESTETTFGYDLSALYVVDNNLAPIMSLSYIACEPYLAAGGNVFHNTLWEQAAAQGITVVVATGDSGSAGCDFYPETAAQYGLAVNGLSSTPFNVAVGGTDFDDLANLATYWNQTNSSSNQHSAKSYIPEIPWNDTCASSGSLTACHVPGEYPNSTGGFDMVAGGGGPSNCINPSGTFPYFTCSGGYLKPSWQSGPGVPSDGARDVPDLSLFAGNGFNAGSYVFCQMDGNLADGGSATSCDLNAPYQDFQAAGGTSVSAQVFAGILALVNQVHGRQGNANYVLYPLASQAGNNCISNAGAASNPSCIFYDIQTGNNSVACQGTMPDCSETIFGDWGIMISGNPPANAYPATAGYDLATGLGSVNVANLVNQWTSHFTPTTTSLSLSTSPATNPLTLTHGQPINLSVNVASGSGTPAGDVSLIAQAGSGPSNVTGMGSFPLGGGGFSGSTSLLPSGSYNVTAHYAGNGTFGASDSAPGIPVTVSKEASNTQVRLVTFPYLQPTAYNVTTVTYGTPYILRMDVTNASGQYCADPVTGLIAYACPTGALTLTPTPTEEYPPPGTIPGTYALNSQGYAEDQPIQMPGGTYNFVAAYAGDENYVGSTSPALPVTVVKAYTDASASGPTSTFVGYPVSVTAKVTTMSMGLPPSGTIQLVDDASRAPYGSPVIVTGTPPTSGYSTTAQAVITAVLPAGQHIVDAYYGGDSNYLSTYSPGIGLNVTDFGLSASPSAVNISAPGQLGSSTISLTSLYGFTGTVALGVASGCPLGATCGFSATAFNLSGSSPMTSPLTITTTAAAPGLQRKVPPDFPLPFAMLCFFAGSLALFASLSSCVTRRRPLMVWLATMLLVVVLWAACGSGGETSPPTPPPTATPAGTYPLVVKASCGSLSHSVTVTVTVQ